MGLNRLLSLSKGNILSDTSKSCEKPPKKSSKSKADSKEKCKSSESGVETQKIDKTLKNGKSASTAKKSMLWTLRITNKNKSGLKKGKNLLITIYSKINCVLYNIISIN